MIQGPRGSSSDAVKRLILLPHGPRAQAPSPAMGGRRQDPKYEQVAGAGQERGTVASRPKRAGARSTWTVGRWEARGKWPSRWRQWNLSSRVLFGWCSRPCGQSFCNHSSLLVQGLCPLTHLQEPPGPLRNFQLGL